MSSYNIQTFKRPQSFCISYANTFYKKLPNEIKKCEQYSKAVNQLRKYFIDKTITRALSMS